MIKSNKKFIWIAVLGIAIIGGLLFCFNGFWIGDYKYTMSCRYKGIEIVDYKGTQEAIEIPTHLGPFRVNHILGKSFNHKNFKKIFVPKDMGFNIEFKECDKLEEVTYEDGTEKLLTEFVCCGNLKKVNIPEGVKEIPNTAFVGSKALDDVIIPKSVTFIGVGAFDNTAFEQKHLGDKYYVVGDGVLLFCNATDEDMVVPMGVKHITSVRTTSRQNYKNFYFPESLEYCILDLNDNNTVFCGKEYIDIKNWSDSGEYVAPAGSPMEKFCKENNLKFRAMTEEEEAVWREKTEAAASEITYQEEN